MEDEKVEEKKTLTFLLILISSALETRFLKHWTCFDKSRHIFIKLSIAVFEKRVNDNSFVRL